MNINIKTSVLEYVGKDTSEFLKAVNLCEQAASIGFDWPSIDPVFDKLDEETNELKEAIEGQNKNEIIDELGDMFFVLTNLARHLGVNPETAIKKANKKFIRRFKKVEQLAFKHDPQKKTFNLETLDKLWNQVKILETPNILKD